MTIDYSYLIDYVRSATTNGIINIPSNVKKTAENICKKRKEKGVSLRAKANALQEEKRTYTRLIKDLYNAISACGNDEEITEIRKLLADLEIAINSYSTSLSELATRFENAKIRILSFGFKSQGKTLFTQLFTKITDEKILKVKSQNTDDDQTGATNIFRHKAGVSADKPEITVYFRKEEDILTLVNNALYELSSLLGETSVPLKFKDYNEFKRYLSDKKKKQEIFDVINGLSNTSNIQSFSSAQSLLESAFHPESDFSMVGSGPISINSNEMPYYNDMQCKTKQRYLSVDHILLELDLGNEGMFENFEICDTKGLSVDAGGNLIEDELVENINRADAVFSIQKIMPSGGKYDDLVDKLNKLSNKGRKNGYITNIADRHFCIVNIYSGMSTTTVDKFVQKLNKNLVAHNLYLGMLVDGEYDGTQIPSKEFVEYLILHMVEQIVRTTQDMDNRLIDACQDQSSKANELISTIKDRLKSLSIIPGKGAQGYILNNVEMLRRMVVRTLIDYSNELKIDLDNSVPKPNNTAEDKSVQPDSNGWDAFIESMSNGANRNNGRGDVEESGSLDTSPYHANHDAYEVLKGKDTRRSIYYALTNRDNSHIKNWTVNQEIDESVKILLDQIVVMDQSHNTCEIESDLILWGGVQPSGDVFSIGCYLDLLSHIFMLKLSDNLESFRKELNPEKEKKIAEIYDKIFTILKIKKLYGYNKSLTFQDVINCSLPNKIIQELCQVVRNLNLNDKGSYTWLPSSYKFIKEYFALETEPVLSTDIAKSVLNKTTANKALTKLLFECKSSIAAEIEMKDSDGMSPIRICISKLIELLQSPEITESLLPLYVQTGADYNYMAQLKDLGLISDADLKRLQEEEERDKLNDVINDWLRAGSITSAF